MYSTLGRTRWVALASGGLARMFRRNARVDLVYLGDVLDISDDSYIV